MDLELLSLLPLPHFLPATLNKDRAGVSSRQPSESPACDLTIYVKEGLIVFGYVLFIRWEVLDAAYLRF